MMVDRELERLGEAQRVAHGCGGALLPAGTQAHQPSLRRDADDPAIALARRNHASDRGAMLFGRIAVAADEIFRQRNLAVEIGMRGVDPAVDHRDADPAPGRDVMERTQMPLHGRRLGRRERIARRRRCLGAIELERLRPGHARIVRNLLDRGFGAEPVGEAHHETIHAQHRHRPVADQGQTVSLGNSRGDAVARALGRSGAIAARISRTRTIMVGRHLQPVRPFSMSSPASR